MGLGNGLMMAEVTDGQILNFSPTFPGLVQHFYMLPLPAPNHRRKNLKLGPLGQFQNLIHHLINALLFNLVLPGL